MRRSPSPGWGRIRKVEEVEKAGVIEGDTVTLQVTPGSKTLTLRRAGG